MENLFSEKMLLLLGTNSLNMYLFDNSKILERFINDFLEYIFGVKNVIKITKAI